MKIGLRFFFMLFSLTMLLTSYVSPEKEKIKWLTLSELHIAYAKQPKPIIIDVYTDWCGWCKVMDKDTYGNDKVVSYINKHYYAVKFNAETTDTVIFSAKKYAYNKEYTTNELAVYLMYGRMSYPTTVLLSSIDAQPAPLSGFLKPSALEAPIKYFGDGAFKKQSFSEFMKTFNKSW